MKPQTICKDAFHTNMLWEKSSGSCFWGFFFKGHLILVDISLEAINEDVLQDVL